MASDSRLPTPAGAKSAPTLSISASDKPLRDTFPSQSMCLEAKPRLRSFLNLFMRIVFHLRGAPFPHGASFGNRTLRSISTLAVINCWE